MRMTKHEIEKKGNGECMIKAAWIDQMRRPMEVRISVTRGELAEDGVHTLVRDTPEDVAAIMFAQAEIAWGMGWRPRGLLGAIPQFIQAFKLPPEAK